MKKGLENDLEAELAGMGSEDGESLTEEQ